MLKNFLRNINYLFKHSLYDEREHDIAYLSDKILDDSLYEFGLSVPTIEKLNVLGRIESFNLFKSNPRSFIRFGDGEINLMLGESQPFQEYDEKLVSILYSALRDANRDDLYICLNHEYFCPQMVHDEYLYREYIRRHGYEFRQFLYNECNSGYIYLDAGMTGFPMIYNQTRKEEAEAYYSNWKKMFSGKDIVIVSGRGIWNDFRFDIFEEASSKKMIYGMPRHAWREHDTLLEKIKATASKDQIIVFALGMAGKAMIYELTLMGYQAWDLGHMNKFYNAFKEGLVYSKETRDDFFSPD